MNAMSPLGITAETLALAKAALAEGMNSQQALAKNIDIATGLTAYDLQAPAKNLYPTITPLRNSMPRIARTNPGDAARWRSIFAITGSGYDSMPWIPEGQRSASMSYNAVPQVAPYLTLGEEDTITFEAESAAVGFEDVNATATMRLLQKMMRKEEQGILGGNSSLQLGVPNAPTLSASGTGGTLPALTPYSVIVVCLTRDGWALSALGAQGIATTKVITGNDGNQYTLYGGSSNKSPNATQNVTLGQTLFAQLTTPPQGTFAYAWFVGAVGSETLQAITTINSVAISAPLLSGQMPATAITQDCSANPALAFDGLMTVAAKPANAAYYQALATGTAGTGSFLTPSGRGSVVEIDNMFISMWNNYRLSPTVMYVNVQEQKNITAKCLTNASGPLLRYNMDADSQGGYNVGAGGVVRWYSNPFSVDGGTEIPIKVHPDIPPGTILAYAERLPTWYQSNEVNNPFEIMLRRDYYRIDWPIRTRRREYGVYAEETLACYAPFSAGLITNIANG